MNDDTELILQHVIEMGENGSGMDDRVLLCEQLARRSPAHNRALLRYLIENTISSRKALETARENQAKVAELLDRLTAPPLHPAVLVRTVETKSGMQALVQLGGSKRRVPVTDDVETSRLKPGATVLLSNELNCVIEACDETYPQLGELAAFERMLPDGRMIVVSRDEPHILDVSDQLEMRTADLKPGTQVRWDRQAEMALEALDDGDNRKYLLEDVPETTDGMIGGNREAKERLISALSVVFLDPEKASQYGLDGARNILLWGPPGCGKTLLARYAASELQRLSGKRCRFAVIKLSDLLSPYHGQTEINIRNCFSELASSDPDQLTVAYLDEIEALARHRGISSNVHSDRHLGALLPEVDGFLSTGKVALICSSNRKDLIDSAALERVSDIDIEVRRPDAQSAREILSVHLGDTPFRALGLDTATARTECLSLAVSSLYSPNAQNALATVKFRDGSTRTVYASDMISGRVISQIAKAARTSAFLRDINTGEPGITLADIELACAQAMEKMANTLTIYSVRSCVDDLPHDIDITEVEKIRHPVRSSSSYMTGWNERSASDERTTNRTPDPARA